MENLKFAERDDFCFVNPLLEKPAAPDPLNELFRDKVHKCANALFHQWEKEINEEIHHVEIGTHWSVYSGLGGYALLLLELGIMQDNEDYLEQAFFLAEKCTMHLHGHELAFLTGRGGPLAVAAVASRKMKQPEREEHFLHRLEKLYQCHELLDASNAMPDEVLYGRAGCLFSLLYVKQHGIPVDDELISLIANSIVASGQRMAEEMKKWEPNGPPLIYEWHAEQFNDLGAAHGLAGILYMLLHVKEHLDSEILEQMIRPTLDFLLSVRFPSGNFPASLDNDVDCFVQWCHGAPGFIHCLIKAWQVFQCDAYLEAAVKCADVIWERGILIKGFGLCHGITGNAFCFLHLYQTTGDTLQLHRACQFARIIIDGSHNLFEEHSRPLSLYQGKAGLIHFLFSLLNPMESCFPGYQIKE